MSAGLDPDRTSFTKVLRLARRTATGTADIPLPPRDQARPTQQLPRQEARRASQHPPRQTRQDPSPLTESPRSLINLRYVASGLPRHGTSPCHRVMRRVWPRGRDDRAEGVGSDGSWSTYPSNWGKHPRLTSVFKARPTPVPLARQPAHPGNEILGLLRCPYRRLHR
jgi:hypothetical protein